jgi:hypothetical protein
MLMKLAVSNNRRFLIHEDGTPFFYLGDTAWELFHRLNREEADIYLRNRAEKKYTVIQAVVLAEFDGLNTPNAYVQTPLHSNDPTRPNEIYFRHVDWIVDRAAGLGIWTGMLPTWGDKWNTKWGKGPVIFTPQNAAVYGEFLGHRYRDKPIIWIMGGDRPVESEEQRSIMNAMAGGIKRGDNGQHLMTFHPSGRSSSSQYFHDADWLDFNMMQSGHRGRNTANYEMIAHDYALTPTKPCMDGEPCYEDHPVMGDDEPREPYHDEYSVRKAAYWALFAGAHGHTYGCHDIWQMWDESRQIINGVRTPWQKAVDLPGAGQMQHARKLMESRPFLVRIPDQSLIVGDAGSGGEHIQATRAQDGSYAFVYIPAHQTVTLDLDKLSGDVLKVSWYNPRQGTAQQADDVKRQGQESFTPPAEGPDWVLVLDDASRSYSPIG